MSIFSKVKQSLYLIKHKSDYIDGQTYYPNCEHKSKSQVLKDQLYLIWKCGGAEPFYFTYGFDRKEITRKQMVKEYIIPYGRFQGRINHLNFQNPRYDNFHGKLTGRVITGDKFYFNVFLFYFFSFFFNSF